MHNLFLGLVKMHFYGIWVQGKILWPNHELAMLHNMLSDFVIPGSCGRLPTDIGVPAGGSLTANQWLLLATIYGPIVVHYVFSHCLSAAGKAVMEKQQEATQKANNKISLTEAKKHRKEAYMTEKTCIAQENFAIAKTKKQERLQQMAAVQVGKAQQVEAKKLYGSSVIKLNHHYSTHVGDCTHNFGPLHDFWTFLCEHLNKVLKSYKANNHANGELKTTFFKEFHCTC
ncbi:hypothetical protein EDD16DRAFT_1690711 [Pisolithus croceorrhizus]|nr:hypothetical protein EDD16DRAFT_1690711 [Pisolithus croceorrhizus]KAI6167652.1 hypothetical protein EDD17DRAFT_1773285 [Pisolithus thermaeus]